MRALTIFLMALAVVNAYFATGRKNQLSNQTLYIEAYSLIKNLTASNISKCLKCKTKLAIGKELALKNPDLIPPLFTQLCLESGVPETYCNSNYGRRTVEHSFQGSDFANMLTIMDPMGYDGQYFCFFDLFNPEQCELPLTPEFDTSTWWPDKKAEHNFAPEGSGNLINVLHISDFHLEKDFAVGAEANCTNNYMCCTSHSYNSNPLPEGYNISELYAEDEVSQLSFYSAFYDDEGNYNKGPYFDFFSNGNQSTWQPTTTYGEYVCDPPEVLINNSLKNMMEIQRTQRLNFDFSIFTGDLVDHDEGYFISMNSTLESEEKIFRDVKHYLGDIPVYAVLGNHDTFPYAQMAPRDSGFNNLFDWNEQAMAHLWEDYGWIDKNASTYASTHYTGFSVVTKKGLKVISLNSNTWYAANYYNFWQTDQPDPFGQFSFLINELVKSEAIGQRVWIIAHVPANNLEAMPVATSVFKQIVERFSPYTIAALFYGHTHLDQFQILYAGNGTENSKVLENAVNVAWVSQSLTTLSYKNPSWRYYEVDDKSFSIINSFNYFTKLNDTFTNDGAEPLWEFEYSARTAYDPEGIFPRDYPLNASFWHAVAQKIKNNTSYNQLYTDYQLRLSPYVPDCSENENCANNYCYVTSFTIDQYLVCYDADLPSVN